MAIEFICEGVDMPKLDFDLLRSWIQQVASAHDRKVGEICYCFCDDPYILKVNNDFLKHDYFTDVITFDYCRGKRISGDVVISLDTVLSNSELVGARYEDELNRVIIHGILHLCGINDKGPGEREVMERHENEALSLLSDLIKEKH
jgi:rRNA maturation RNase YbeY